MPQWTALSSTPSVLNIVCPFPKILSNQELFRWNQTISDLEGVWSKLFDGNETDIFHTHHTCKWVNSFHGLLPIEQRQLRICEYSWWYNIGENSFFLKHESTIGFVGKKVKLAKGRGCVTTKLERLREWNDFSTSCKSWKGFFTLPSEKVWNKG